MNLELVGTGHFRDTIGGIWGFRESWDGYVWAQ